jgi:hypothetical protein
MLQGGTLKLRQHTGKPSNLTTHRFPSICGTTGLGTVTCIKAYVYRLSINAFTNAHLTACEGLFLGVGNGWLPKVFLPISRLHMVNTGRLIQQTHHRSEQI